ncbi:cobalamin biosynthesis protein CbiX [Streptomyces sp. NBC_01218]|uniref:cobalamin biosynthesis protein CbiX n=1 Tax=Streptomyces sp. NBC_01218 TaxID=2903780 RepID=UPI002E0F8C2B
MTMVSDHRVIAVCGHEAGYGTALRDLEGSGVTVVADGRELYRAVAGTGPGEEPVCVVPMTLGRDARLVADTARTLRALPPGIGPRALLAAPFGTSQHLVAWLRAAAGRVPAGSALLVTAPAGDPFDDAELHRVTALVRRYGNHPLVEVAFTGGDPDPAEGVRRCLLLGADRVVVLSAAFAVPDPAAPVAPDLPGIRVEHAGPPVSRTALARILAERAVDARRRWSERNDDGISAGLSAADDHGHGHTHPPGEGHDHDGHSHSPGEGHDHDGHSHRHSHPSGEEHDHAHEHPGHGHTHPPGEDHDHDHGHPHDHHGHPRDHDRHRPESGHHHGPSHPHPGTTADGAARPVRSSA